MRQMLFLIFAAVVILPAFSEARAEITVTGTNVSLSGPGGAFTTYLAGERDAGCPIACEITDHRTGQWITRVAGPGTYTAAVEEAFGFGPIVRPGIILGRGGMNRVNIVLPFAYDLVSVAKLTEDAHNEYGQSFVASGNGITAIVFKNADDVLISLHQDDAKGQRVGQTVPAASYYREGTLPTVPGSKYYLRFVHKDGKTFKMQVAEGNKYLEGSATIDGRSQSSLDLGLRIQHNPSGQILRCKPGMTEVYKSAKRSYGQTFIARGTSLAMLSVFPASGDAATPAPAVRILESGPGGKQIGPAVASRIVVFNPGQLVLVPGQRYYFEVTADAADGPLRMWASREDDFPGGELHLDGSPVAQRDLAMILVEYDADEVAPPRATATSHRPGTNAYGDRYPADGRVRIVWDVPASNDISKMVVHRFIPGRGQAESGGKPLAEIPVAAQGRYQLVDSDMENDVEYQYTVRLVDAAGNESEPLQAPVTLRPAIPMCADLLNGDFSGPNDLGVPFGWIACTIAGGVPAFRLDPPQGDRNPIATVGWEVPQEEGGNSDTVLYQRVPCEKGRKYRLAAETRLWNPWNNRKMVICAVVGIDPAGGSDPLAESVIWSAPAFQRGEWTARSVTAKAEADWITVYLRGYCRYARLMNTRFRNVTLTDVTCGQ